MDEGRDLDGATLIDVASEDDLLLCASAAARGPPGPHESCGSLVDKPSKSCLKMDQVPVPSDSPEIKHDSSCKYNLRRSLAWDSAFFTSEGVLDPEELAIVNSTFRKVQINVLPGIQEDARKSGESCTTLDSDSWAAENNEIDLFENIRASIQNFQANCGKSSSSDSSKREKLDIKRIGTSKNERISSQVKVKKPPFIPKKEGFSGQRLVEKTTRSAGHQHVIKVSAGSREEKPSPRPLRTPSGLKIAPSKGPTVTSSVHIKSKNEGNNLPVTASKRHITGDQGKVAAKSSTSVKAKLHLPAVCSSNNGSGGISYARIDKAPPPSDSIKKKLSSTDFNKLSSKSASSYPARASKDMSRTRTTNATLKISPSVSPSSSIDSFASESSSCSTSTTRIPATPTGALDYVSSPCLGFTAYNAPRDISTAKSLKPSGLRLPSPKIGYFDAGNSVPHSAHKSLWRPHQVGTVRNMSVPQENSGKDALATPTKLNNPDHLELTNPPATGSPPTLRLLQVKRCSDMLDNVGEPQNYSKRCPTTTNQGTSCNPKNITLTSNTAALGTPDSRQLPTLSIEEDRRRVRFHPSAKRAITAGGGEPVVPGEGTEVREIAGGKALEAFFSHIRQSSMEDRLQTISIHEDKENSLPPPSERA